MCAGRKLETEEIVGLGGIGPFSSPGQCCRGRAEGEVCRAPSGRGRGSGPAGWPRSQAVIFPVLPISGAQSLRHPRGRLGLISAVGTSFWQGIFAPSTVVQTDNAAENSHRQGTKVHTVLMHASYWSPSD